MSKLRLSLIAAATAALVTTATAARAETACPPVHGGEHCTPGYGRTTEGGGGKVSHKGWPRLTGVYFNVVVPGRNAHHSFTGTKYNDELLGYDGHDHLVGAGGSDILWGDSRAVPQNPASQDDVLVGGGGKDFIYTSHGHNTVRGGRGNDRVYAHWGHGVIDCGPGDDWVGINHYPVTYELRHCEHEAQW
jgi:Ca2+-binding RTX toxin-like protein